MDDSETCKEGFTSSDLPTFLGRRAISVCSFGCLVCISLSFIKGILIFNCFFVIRTLIFLKKKEDLSLSFNMYVIVFLLQVWQLCAVFKVKTLVHTLQSRTLHPQLLHYQ